MAGICGIDASRFQSKKQTGVISYADPRYWNARYTEKGADPKQDLSFATFDWYLRFEQLKESLLPLLPDKGTPPKAVEGEGEPTSTEDLRPRILVLGCGTSTLTEELYNDGYVRITNLDRCEALIEHFAAKHQDKAETMQYVASDCKCLPQEWNGQFDVVIDKACLDVIAGSKDARTDIPATLSAISRVLNPLTGVYICISHASPELRQPMLSGTNNLQVVASKIMRWWVSCHPLQRLMQPPPDPNVKGGPPKGGVIELKPSQSFQAETHVYNMYVCRRPAKLVDDATGWFDFWASPATELTRDTLPRSLIKSLYIPETERSQLRATVTKLWDECCGNVDSIQCNDFVQAGGLYERLVSQIVPKTQESPIPCDPEQKLETEEDGS